MGKRPGRKRWMIGLNALNLNFQNGLEKDLAKKLESLSLLMMKMKDQQKLPQVPKRKRSRYHASTCRANKNIFHLCHLSLNRNCYNFFLVISVQIHVSALLDTKFQLNDSRIN